MQWELLSKVWFMLEGDSLEAGGAVCLECVWGAVCGLA